VEDEEVLAFITAALKSIWTLELLLFLRREPGRACASADLVKELRASARAVEIAAANLEAIGLVTAEGGSVRFEPASAQLVSYVEAAELLYRTKPTSVFKALASSPDEKLRQFANSFRLKD
jgi:hypothetical protein